MFLVDIRDLLFVALLAGFLIYFIHVLSMDRHIAPRQRFEWDKRIKAYKYVEGHRFHYIGDPIDWFPVRVKVCYRIRGISIECIISADWQNNYTGNLMKLCDSVGIKLHAICLEICHARKLYPEQDGTPDWLGKTEEGYYSLLNTLQKRGLKMESFIVRDGRKVLRVWQLA